jgi:hypothetical protein
MGEQKITIAPTYDALAGNLGYCFGAKTAWACMRIGGEAAVLFLRNQHTAILAPAYACYLIRI